jgi:hypothetical protein
MGSLALDSKLLTTISLLAERLKTTKEDVVAKAVDSYIRKLNPKNRLMQFAGILDEEEADTILEAIHSKWYFNTEVIYGSKADINAR